MGSEVRAPERIIWSSDLTLMGAIDTAGGFDGTPNVNLIRGKERTKVHIRQIVQNESLDPLLEPGDVVEVDQGSF